MSMTDPSGESLPNDRPAFAVPPRTLAKNEILNEWLNTRYFQHVYHNCDLSIQVKDFVTIPFEPAAYGTRNWLVDDQLVVPMVLATEDQGRADMLVIPPFPAQALALVGLGESSREVFIELHLNLYLQMMSDTVRWIVVPCTDAMPKDRVVEADPDSVGESQLTNTAEGITQEGSASLTESTKNPTVNSKQGRGRPRKNRPIGQCHWGFMIVDKKESQASWLDGHLDIRLRRDEYHIHHMYRAGRAAGKVLCGIDTVMERERGQFAAATLKHVPHDSDHNRFRGDRGSACGPWVFAMFRYILNHPDLLTEANGLNGAFDVARRAGHVTNMAFHSQQTRLAMQRIIDDQVSDRIEKQAAGLVPAIPTAPLIKMLNSGYHDFLLAIVNDFLDRTAPEDPAFDDDGNGTDDSDSEDSDGDDDFGKPPHVFKKTFLRETIAENPGSYEHLPTKNARYERAVEDLLERQANKDKEKKAAEVAATQNPHSKKWVTRRYPEGVDDKAILPDFATLMNMKTNDWGKPYEATLFQTNIRQGYAFVHMRAVLHRTFKGSFRGEPLESLRGYVDEGSYEYAFDRDERSEPWTADSLAIRLDAAYVNLEVPLFASLTDEQIDPWMTRLPPTALELVTDPHEKDANKLGNVRYSRARGLLHRMFVGELDEMSADDIRRWREDDPYIGPAHTSDNETAMIKMKILYEGPGFENVPYLRESPLHWPPRRHRPDRGEKRKRGNDDRGDDEDDDDANDGKRFKTAANETEKDAEFREAPDVNDKFGTGYSEGSKSTQDPKTAKDPKTIDWSMIGDIDLEPYLTDEVRRDPRIGNRFNKYTYRAILFLKHGGTFKNDSQEKRTTIWVRDTNVFSHGIHPEEKEEDAEAEENISFDLTLLSTGQFDIRPVAKDILKRMADKYEPEVAAPTDEPEAMVVDTPGDGGAATSSEKPANIRSVNVPNASSANGPNAPSANIANPPSGSVPTAPTANAPAAAAANLHTVNFTWMPEAELDSWIARLPAAAKVQSKPSTGQWTKKAILQKLYGGGFGTLSAKDIKQWHTQDSNFRKLKLKRGWTPEWVVPELERRTAETPAMDCRGPLGGYPEKYVHRWNNPNVKTVGKGKGKGKGLTKKEEGGKGNRKGERKGKGLEKKKVKGTGKKDQDKEDREEEEDA